MIQKNRKQALRYLHTHVQRRAALLKIVKTWKQPKCPLTEEWVSKMWHTHNGILCSLKKEGHSDTCYNINGP